MGLLKVSELTTSVISEICCESSIADTLGKKFLPKVVAGANMYSKSLDTETIKFAKSSAKKFS